MEVPILFFYGRGDLSDTQFHPFFRVSFSSAAASHPILAFLVFLRKPQNGV